MTNKEMLTKLMESVETLKDNQSALNTAIASLDCRIKALEDGPAVSATASKPVVQKPKASANSNSLVLLEGQYIYTTPEDVFIHNNYKYAFEQQSNAPRVSGEARNNFIKAHKGPKSKFMVIWDFGTPEKAAAFYAKWNEGKK